RLMAYPMLEDPTERSERLTVTPFAGRIIAGAISAASVVLLVIPADALLQRCNDASQLGERAIQAASPDQAPETRSLPTHALSDAQDD
ncbi:MAG: hypothetical protein KDA21_07850, partial [Phycisphaerales bacterium]|nr:hypothetical protein [Phycisphaerales bacterium]